jgi:hypothetical protein
LAEFKQRKTDKYPEFCKAISGFSEHIGSGNAIPAQKSDRGSVAPQCGSTGAMPQLPVSLISRVKRRAIDQKLLLTEKTFGVKLFGERVYH